MLVRSTLLRKRACKLTLHALLRPVLRREREEFLLTMSSSTAYCVRVQGVPQFFKNPIEVCKNIIPNFLKTCSSLGSEKKKKNSGTISIHRFSNKPFLNPSSQSITSPRLHKIFPLSKEGGDTRTNRATVFLAIYTHRSSAETGRNLLYRSSGFHFLTGQRTMFAALPVEISWRVYTPLPSLPPRVYTKRMVIGCGNVGSISSSREHGTFVRKARSIYSEATDNGKVGRAKNYARVGINAKLYRKLNCRMFE